MLGALVLLAACAADESVEVPLPVTVVTAVPAGGAGGPRYSASLAPDVQVDVAFKVSGYVEEIRQVRGADGRTRNLQDGDYVTRGTVLARVRSREYRDAESQAAAALGRSRADLARVTQLYESRAVSKADYDAAWARFQADQAEHDRAAQMVEDCALLAPLDGYVMARGIEVGSLATPGGPAFSIGSLGSLKVVFGVPDVMVSDVRLGAAQDVTIDAVPGEVFRGRYTRIAPAADPTSRTFQAEVTVSNTDGRLRPGMIAALAMKDGREAAPGALLVPLHAVIRPPGSDSGYAVFVVEASGTTDVARLRPVSVGDISGNDIAVTAGMVAGERVIVRGATLAVDAAPVRIIP